LSYAESGKRAIEMSKNAQRRTISDYNDDIFGVKLISYLRDGLH
jgi:hypothetical protein